MNIFKSANIQTATAWDWNVKKIVKRHKGDSKKLRRYARHRLKQNLRKNDGK